jgi:hypothetical protein
MEKTVIRVSAEKVSTGGNATDGSIEHDHTLSKKSRENVIRSFTSSLGARRVNGGT